jgi:hypothetical protein
MIEDIVAIDSKLHANSLSDRKVLAQGEVNFGQIRTDQTVSAFVPESSASGLGKAFTLNQFAMVGLLRQGCQ